MRLLNTRTIEVVDGFLEGNTPAYAILSHTWEKEEVTLQEIQRTAAREKDGYSKIKATCDRALKDGFDYAWVDTCCIDKSSSTELSEAINSMFRWYQQAAICYVYLSDVEAVDRAAVDLSSENFKSQFRNSKWFTRGWTLQELIAPSKLIFFAENWSLLSGRAELSGLINETTGIAKEVLLRSHGIDITQLLNQASIAERMSWAAARKTTRIEDTAYSLMGIFEVNMPLLYGEGGNAFLRLQQEIARNFSDQSLLAWRYDSKRLQHGLHSIFADSPAAFSHSGDIVPFDVDDSNPSFSITNRGLRITLPLSKESGVLQCRRRGDVATLITVPLRKIRDGFYARGDTDLLGCIDYRGWHQWHQSAIYLATNSKNTRGGGVQNGFVIRNVPEGFNVPGFPGQPEATIFPLRNLSIWRCGQGEDASAIPILFQGKPVAFLTLSAWRVSVEGMYKTEHTIRTSARFTQQCDKTPLTQDINYTEILPNGGILYAKIKPTRVFGRRLFMVDIEVLAGKFAFVKLQVASKLYATYHRAVLTLIAWFPVSAWSWLALISQRLVLLALLGGSFSLIPVVILAILNLVPYLWSGHTSHWLPLDNTYVSEGWKLVVAYLLPVYFLLEELWEQQRYEVFYPRQRNQQLPDNRDYLPDWISLWVPFLLSLGVQTLAGWRAHVLLFVFWCSVLVVVSLADHAAEETKWHSLMEEIWGRGALKNKCA